MAGRFGQRGSASEAMTIRRRLAEQWDSRDVLSSLWRLFASPWTTIVLLLALGLLICATVLLPQLPSEAALDPVAASVWLASFRAQYGLLAEWMVRLSLINLIHSAWLRVLLGLLGFNLILVAADLWQQLRTRESDQNQSAGRVGLWASLLVVCGLVLILAGGVVQERLAWREGNVSLRPGQVKPVGHGSGLAFRADLIKSHYDPSTGLVHGGQTELTFLNADGVAGRKVLFDQTPSFFSGLMFHQVSTEPVLLIRAADAAGHRLALQTPETGASELGEVTLRFRDEEASRYIVVLGVPGQTAALQFQQKGNQGYVLVPERDLSLRVSFALPPQGGVEPLFQVEAFRGAETAAFQQVVITSTEVIEIDGDRYTLEPQRHALIQFGRDYSPLFSLLGGVLVVAGLCLYAWQAARRQRNGRKAVAELTLILALGILLWAVTRNWAVAQLSSNPASLPLLWWQALYWVDVLACAALAAAFVEGVVSWTRAIRGRATGGPWEESRVLFLGIALLTLVLLLNSVSRLYTRGACWEWARTETLGLAAWIFFAEVWFLHALRGWRGQRIAILSIMGIVPVLLCLIMPGR